MMVSLIPIVWSTGIGSRLGMETVDGLNTTTAGIARRNGISVATIADSEWRSIVVTALIHELKQAGVDFRVCGQALLGGYARIGG